MESNSRPVGFTFTLCAPAPRLAYLLYNISIDYTLNNNRFMKLCHYSIIEIPGLMIEASSRSPLIYYNIKYKLITNASTLSKLVSDLHGINITSMQPVKL